MWDFVAPGAQKHTADPNPDPPRGPVPYQDLMWVFWLLGDGQPDFWGQYVYDAVWLYARAINALERAGKNPFDGDSLRSALLSQRFEGKGNKRDPDPR